MKLNILLLILIVSFIPFVVNAKYDITNPNCTNEEKIKLRNEATKIRFINEKYTKDDKVYYSIEILNLINTISIQDIDTKQVYKTDGEKILSILPGSIKKLLIYANENSVCDSYTIFTKNITIPHYNIFINHDLCKGNEEHILCKENTSIKIKEDEFIRIMNAYIKEKNNKSSDKPIEEPDEENVSIYSKVMDFLLNYYIYILIGIIILGTSGIVILEIRRRRSIL